MDEAGKGRPRLKLCFEATRKRAQSPEEGRQENRSHLKEKSVLGTTNQMILLLLSGFRNCLALAPALLVVGAGHVAGRMKGLL